MTGCSREELAMNRVPSLRLGRLILFLVPAAGLVIAESLHPNL